MSPSMASSILAKAPKAVRRVICRGNDLADHVLVGHDAPRFGRQPAQAQADALAFFVHVHHVDFDLLTDFQDLAGVLDAMPRQLRQMDQPIGAAQVDERTEVGDAGHDALEHVARVAGWTADGLSAPCASRAWRARSERISRLRRRSSSTTLSCIFWPTNRAHRCSGSASASCWPCQRRRAATRARSRARGRRARSRRRGCSR